MFHKVITILSVSTSLTLAIDPDLIKGSQSLMNEDKTDLAPVYAATMLETRWLENLRLLWQTGLKQNIEPYAQLKGTQTDNPHSQTALLLQYLFPSPDGAALALNNREFFPLRYLTHTQLGEIFALADQGGSPEKYLRSIVASNRRSEAAKLATVMKAAFSEDGDQFFPNLARHCFIAYILKTATTKDQVWDFLIAAKLTKSMTDEEKNGAKINFLNDSFPANSYDLFKSTMTKSHFDETRYQELFMPLHAYMALEQAKIDLGRLRIYRDGVKIEKLPSAESLLTSVRSWHKYRPNDTTLKFLLSNPELLYHTGYAYSKVEKDDFLVPYGTAYWTENKTHSNFSDCAEAALFSLVNGLIFNKESKRPTPEKLPDTAIPELKKLYQDIAASSKPLAAFRPQFSRLVSNINGLKYVQESPAGARYELVSNIDNFINAFRHVMGLENVVQDDKLFEFFSSDKTSLTIEADDSQPNILVINCNQSPWIKIQSFGNHTEIKLFVPSVSWGHLISRKLLSHFYESSPQPTNLIFSALFESKYLWPIISSADETSPTQNQLLTTALCTPLGGTHQRTKMLRTGLIYRDNTVPVINQLSGLAAKISFEDPRAALQLVVLFHNLGAAKVKAIRVLEHPYNLYLELCQKNPLFAWLGYLLWQDPELENFLDRSFVEPQGDRPLEVYLPHAVFLELFSPQSNSNFRQFSTARKTPPASIELQTKFLELYENLIQENPSYKSGLAPNVISDILEELMDANDLQTIKAVIEFTRKNNIILPFSYNLAKIIISINDDEKVCTSLIEQTDIQHDDTNSYWLFKILIEPTVSESIKLYLVDKIIRDRPAFFSSSPNVETSYINSLLSTYSTTPILFKELFSRFKKGLPKALFTTVLCYTYAYNSLPDDVKNELLQFITDHKAEFKALYTDPTHIPNILKGVLS